MTKTIGEPCGDCGHALMLVFGGFEHYNKSPQLDDHRPRPKPRPAEV